MSRDQAEIKAITYTRIAVMLRSPINYRAERTSKKEGVERWSVIQYLGEDPVGIAAS